MTNAEPLYKVVSRFEPLDNSKLEEAKETFELYKTSGVLSSDCKFEDETWKMTDEYSNVGIHFNFAPLTYKKYYEPILGFSMSEFILYVKIFVTIFLGQKVLKTIQTIVNDLKRLIRTDIKDVCDSSSDLKLAVPNACIDFFSLLPDCMDPDSMESLMNGLDQYANVVDAYSSDKKRMLAQFDSYFLFNDILNDYWKLPLEQEERLFFYPLYFWWQITGVIPLRPCEFILTQKNCLKKLKDGYYLTIRRNRLKGKSDSKQVHYKIDEDYTTDTYKIPERLAQEIEKYQELTKCCENTELETLFTTDSHYRKWGQKKHKNSRYLTYINLNTIMRYFFNEVIEKKYHLKTVYGNNGEHLAEGEINYLHLGDTRHLALINIIAEGGTPMIAMMLAGHESADMASHYYSNITNLIECRTYRQYRLVTQGNVNYQVSTYKALPERSESVELSDFSYCYSEKFRNGDFSDCQTSAGKNGEIGYCPLCSFNRKKGKTYYSDDTVYKRRIEDDCKLLEDAIHIVRSGCGETESISEALLRLKSSSYDYQQYCQEKEERRRKKGKNGKTSSNFE